MLRRPFIACAALFVLTVIGYHRTLDFPFHFDDEDAIVRNASLRSNRPLWAALTPPKGGTTVAGRPLLNLSFALNYRVGGANVRGYHAVNITIHVLAGLILFGWVRRTFELPSLRTKLSKAAIPSAAAAAAIWMLHPLQTESVAYIAQRAESLAGLFYISTLYCVARVVSSPSPRMHTLWGGLGVASCALGMGVKEVMVTCPLISLLYDRAFTGRSLTECLKRHRWFYAGLGATWIVLGMILLGMEGSRGTSAGFGHGITAIDYATAQCQAIVHYLRLTLWPHALVFDYGIFSVRLAEVWPQAVLLLVATIAMAIGLARNRPFGFAAAMFFAVLAPSSSIVPITTQTMAEHRVYLALAPVAAAMVMIGHTVLGRRAAIPALLVSLALLTLTYSRNDDYRSRLTLWRDTQLKRPDNPRAHDNYAIALMDAGRYADAIVPFTTALRLNPGSPSTHEGIGTCLFHLGRFSEAAIHYATAVQLNPLSPTAHDGLAATALQRGDALSAAHHWQEAIRLAPGRDSYRRAYAGVLYRLGRVSEAVNELQAAVALDPTNVDAQIDLAALALATGNTELALVHANNAVQRAPSHATARINLAAALNKAGRFSAAFEQARIATQLSPAAAQAHFNLAEALLGMNRLPEAIDEYVAELRIDGSHPGAIAGLALAYLKLGRPIEAVPLLERAALLQPNSGQIQNLLGLALLQSGRIDDAVTHFQLAVELEPSLGEARENLAKSRARAR